MLLALIMVLGLIPVNAFAAGKTVSQYFDGLPVTADPGTGTTAWKVGTKDGQELLKFCFLLVVHVIPLRS